MKQAAVLLQAILSTACVLGAARAVEPDTFSPVVSYQYLDSLEEPGTHTPVISPVVSYQYFDWPGDANLTFQNSSSVSYVFQYPSALAITPDRGTAFGSIQSGGTRDQTFTLTNSSNSAIAGTISVAAPFSVVGGAGYSLMPGQTKTVTVRFSPTTPGSYSAYLTFGNGSSWLLTASAYADFTTTTGEIAGVVTDSVTHLPVNGVSIGIGSSANSSVFAITGGSGAQAGKYAVTGLAPNAHYQITATVSGQKYSLKKIENVAVAVGQTTSLDIELDPVTTTPLVLTTKTTPLVLIRGLGKNIVNDSTWGTFSKRLKEVHNFTEVWDCNGDAEFYIPDTNLDPTPVVNGELAIAENGTRLLYFIRARALDYKDRHSGSYPSEINIVTHSMGGLIVRQAIGQNGHGEYFSFLDDNGHSFQIRVNTVVMLAPPNAGSYLADTIFDPTSVQNWVVAKELKVIIPAADWFTENDIPQPSWESTKELQTSTIRQFSLNNPWPDPINLRLLAATASSAATSPLDLANNWIISRLRDMHLSQSPEVINDGAVTRPSVDGDYYEAKPSDITIGGNHVFNVSRYSTFVTRKGAPVPTSVTDVQVTGHVLDHSTILTDNAIIDEIASVLGGDPWHLATESSSGRQLAAVSATPSAPSQSIEYHAGSVHSAEVAETSVISDAANELRFQLLANSTRIAFKLQDPAGNIIDSTTPQINPTIQNTTTVNGGNVFMTTYAISNPASGTWKVIVDATAISESQTDYLVTASVDSDVTLISKTASQFSKGQDAVVSCALADINDNSAVPVTNAAISATLQLQDGTTTTLNLTDDGLHNDGAPKDGIYAAVLPAVAQAGQYLVTYRATGQNSQGQALQRVASGAFSVSSSNANLLGDPAFVTVDTDGDGVADSLQAKCGVSPKTAGNYILSGQLADAGGTLEIPASAQFYVDGGGATTVSLFFDLSLAKAAALSGEFHIENLQLFEVPASSAVWVDTYRGTAVTQLSFGPAITTQPEDTTTVAGGQASFTVSSTSNGPLSYQWQVSTDGGGTWNNLANDGAHTGVKTPTLTLNGIVVAMNGHQFRAVLSDGTNASTSSATATLTVKKSDQKITFSGPGDCTYGDLPFELDATSGSGLPVSYTVLEGPAIISGSRLTVAGAGTVTLRASQPGDANYAAALDVDRTFTVAKAPLTVTADNQSRAFGAPNPTLTFSYSGFVNGDTATVVDTLPMIATAADTRSPAGSFPITLTGGSDDNYALTLVDGVLTVIPANTAPMISVIANQTTPEDTATGGLAFTVGDAETAGSALMVTSSSSNPTLIPNANIALGGSGANRTVTVTPAANANGSAMITLTVSDGEFTTSTHFTLTVTAVNDAPTISTIADQTTKEDTATRALSFTVGDVETAAATLTVSAASSNPALIPPSGIALGGSGETRTVKLTPTANASGTATITLTVSDGSAMTSTHFTLTVTSVNDAPTITKPADVVIAKGRNRTITFKVSDTETTASKLAVTRSSSNTTLLPTANLVLGGASGNRTLKLTPVATRTGTATVTLVVSDGTAKTKTAFKVTVASAPTIAAITDQTTNEDTTTVSIAVKLADLDTSTTKLKLSATSSNATLVPANAYSFGGSGANRSLKIKPAANKNGSATITVTVSDGALTASTSFKLTVKAVNDRPTISAIANQKTNRNTATKVIAFKIADLETVATKLKLTKASSNTKLLPTANIIIGGVGGNRTVTLKPATSQTGTVRITLTVSDGLLSANRTFTLTVNAPPTITKIANQTISKNKATAALKFTVGDAETTTSKLKLTATSSNTALVPTSRIVFAGTAANRTVKITPVTNKIGSSKITLMVSDGTGTASTSFWVTVTSAVKKTSTATAMAAKPVFTKHPKSQVVKVGTTVTLTVEAGGAQNYRWLHDGKTIAGETSATLKLPAVKLTQAGGYTATASNGAGAAKSDTAELTVVDDRLAAVRAGSIVAVTQTLTVAGASDGLTLSVPLPAKWTYVAGETASASTSPQAGDESFLEWTWKHVPPGALTFTYVLDVPVDQPLPTVLGAGINVQQDDVQVPLWFDEVLSLNPE